MASNSGTDTPRECGRCGEEYDPYTFFTRKGFNATSARFEIERKWGNVCRDCRREVMNSHDWGLL